MRTIISFEKFVALRDAGLLEARDAAQMASPQFHSTSEDFTQSIAQRAGRGGAKKARS